MQAMAVAKLEVAVPLSSCPGRCSERGGCVARTLRGGQQLPGACRCFKGYGGESCEGVVEGQWANNCYNNCSGGCCGRDGGGCGAVDLASSAPVLMSLEVRKAVIVSSTRL
jgi:hypothetical protein